MVMSPRKSDSAQTTAPGANLMFGAIGAMFAVGTDMSDFMLKFIYLQRVIKQIINRRNETRLDEQAHVVESRERLCQN